MSKLLQLRGGTTAEHASFTGAVREVTVDTDKDTLVIHDGSTVGGFPLPRTDAEIRTSVEAATDSNVFTDADHTKLNAIEAAATADQTKADIDALNINADLLDGQHGAYYTGYTDTAVAGIVDSSPAALNTLNELAAALGDDANFATTTANSIGTKLPLAGGAVTGNVTFGDSNKAVFGAGSDLQIYHDGSHSIIKDSGTGELFIQGDSDVRITNAAGSEFKANFITNGAVELFYDNTRRIHTTSSGANVTGVLATDGITMGDGEVAKFGDSNDLQIYHDGANSFIKDVGSGNLSIMSDGAGILMEKTDGENIAFFDTTNSNVELFEGGIKRLETTSTGIDVTGTINGGDLRGDVWYIGRDNNDYFQVGTTSQKWFLDGAEEMRLENDGDLHVDGNVIAYSTTISDERLKTDIVKIDGALDKVAQLNGYTFTYTADGKKSAGVIAQEVQKVLPSAIVESKLPLKMGEDDETEYMTVQYDQLMGLMIEAIKELKAEVAELKGK